MTRPREVRPISVLLIAEDESDTRHLQELLRDPVHWKFEFKQVDLLAPPPEGLAGPGIDVVLLDLGLSGGSGLSTFELVRDASPEKPIIVICAVGDESAAQLAVRVGAQDYLIKGSIERNLLTRVIRYAIEKKRAEREMARNQSRFGAIVQNSSDAITIFDANGAIIFATPATSRILGYSLNDFIGRNAAEFIRPDSHQYFRERLEESLRRPGQPIPVLAHVRHKDGSWRLCEGKFTNLLDEPGVEGIVNSFHDITEDRRKETLVGWLTLAVDQGPAAVIMTDTAGHIEYVNQKFTEDTGYTSAEAVGKPTSILKSDTTPPEQYATLWATINSGRLYRGELENRRKNGEFYWNDVQISPVRDATGAITHFLGVQTDISAQKKNNVALREANERYLKLTDASFDAIAVSQDGIVREANQGFVEMFGCARIEDVIGRPLMDFVAEESRTEVERRIANDIEGTYELVGLREDGKKVLLDVTARTHAIAGRPGRITALRDMTERRSLETQFRQAQKMEAVGRLAGGVAHDFNNLLTVILSYTDLLIEGVSPKDPRGEDLDQIRKAAVAAASLTRQLLAFSRQQVIEPRVVDLNEVVADAEKMLRRLIGEDITLQTTLPPSPLTVKIDPGQIEQVIMNLAVNARDAMPTGGKLTLETQSTVLDDAYARDHWPAQPGRFAMLAVSDTGSGMDELTRSRIFEPFFTTKELGKGTGLGLATVYGIIKQSNGFIWVYSEPGQGTSFKIYLPLVDQPAEEHVDKPASETPPSGTETILLVEDSAAVRVAVRQILERCGYTVLEAPNGTLALSTARRTSTIDLLLTDVVMPEMSGRELSDQFAMLRPNTKVLLMSGYTDDAVIRHGVLRPGTAYLQKPFSAETLARKIREVLDSHVGTG